MILSTHSIEEAEALCDTISWMNNGKFVFIGTPEQLKIQYSSGYQLHIKFQEQKEEIILEEQDSINKLEKIIYNYKIIKDEIKKNKEIEKYLPLLSHALETIFDKSQNNILNEICADYSFNFTLKIKKQNQKDVFTKVLNMKNDNEKITEISIKMQSLESILTTLFLVNNLNTIN